MSGSLRRLPAWAITASLGLVYVIAAPPSTDLAAAAYRSDLFARTGFGVWDNSWYGGHHLPAYSLLAPALGAWLGPQLLNAVSMVAATALFALLIDGFFPRAATRVAAVWFAVGASIALLANRVPYDLGLAVGLGCLLAARRDRRPAALALAVLCSLASPVAGAFLALSLLAWGIAGRTRGTPAAPGGARRVHPLWPFVLTAATLAPIAALTVAFPEGGTQPFVTSAFLPALAGVLVIAVLVPRAPSERGRPGSIAQVGAGLGAGVGGERERFADARRVLLIGVLLYGAALVGAYAIPSAVGGNVDRLGALLAGPIAACVLVGRSPRWPLVVLAPLLLYWQANAPVADFLSAASDPAVNASYYTPLVRELHSLGVGYGARPARIEAVATVDHWEARFLAPRIPLARGWERQLDRGRNGLFYDEHRRLSAGRYRAWLARQAVSYVALPDAPLDYSAAGEARLLRGRPPEGLAGRPPAYLREVWRSAHWRLFAVIHPRALVQPPARMVALRTDSFAVSIPRPGRYGVAVRFTPYWAASGAGACVAEGAGGFTELDAHGSGVVRVRIDFSIGRIFDHGPRCR